MKPTRLSSSVGVRRSADPIEGRWAGWGRNRVLSLPSGPRGAEPPHGRPTRAGCHAVGVPLLFGLVLARAPDPPGCPNGECGYDPGYSTAETIALVAFGLVALAIVAAIVFLIRRRRRGPHT